MTAARTRRPGGPVGAARFERSLPVIVGLFGLLYSLQTLDSFVADWPSIAGPLGAVAVALVAVGVLLGLVAVVLPGTARSLFLAAAAAYAAGAVLWPSALHAAVPNDPMPWFVAMWITPFSALAAACRRPVAPALATVAAAVFLPAVLVVRGGSGFEDAAGDAVFLVALSAVLLLLVSAIRRGVDRADAAQRSVLARFARSSVEEATEAERIRTDALVHDSVLTTFLSAADAHGDEAEDLAVRMAENALRVLSHVTRSAAHGPVVPFLRALAEAEPTIEPYRGAFRVDTSGLDDLVLPAQVAEAVLGAAVQAMANSVQHGGPAARRTVTMTPLGPDGLRIVVEDDGVGFDPARPTDRLGVRTSIVERMRLVDGRAEVDSAPGDGCRVRLSWGSVVVHGTAPLRESESAVTA